MAFTRVEFEDWIFAVDRDLTEKAYENRKYGGAEGCKCDDCKNYIACRENIFPKIVKDLFQSLGIDYRKEVETMVWDVEQDNLRNISGWFHFKGEIISGKNCKEVLPSGGSTLELTQITEGFSIGFTYGKDLTFFTDKLNLVQVEFMSVMPIVLYI